MKELTTRYSDAELEEFRIHIEQKIAEAKTELERTQKQIADINENGFNQQGGDWYDDTSNHTDLEMLQRMAQRQVELIRHLHNALLRIKNRTYGVCHVTGKLIDKRRLLLVPHTTKSVEGKTIDKITQQQQPSVDINARLINEEEQKQPHVMKSSRAKFNGKFTSDTSDFNGPSQEQLEDAGFDLKIDED